MANKYNNPNKGGPQYSVKKGSPSGGSLSMKTGSFKGNIGKSGPNRDTWGVDHPPQCTQKVGI